MLETRTRSVWEERETLSCQGERVPVVPVEVQLATMVARGQDERIAATLAPVDGVRLGLLRRAIADRRVEDPAMTVPPSLRRLLEVESDV
jgi:hypothetical protein